ncbi:MAG TPA: type II secretion system protein [bacterium]|nr:type II secretion system protein [bacterium]
MNKKGFTLIELMIVVAIIGILAAVAIPRFADLIRKSKEGATKGNLGAVRSATTIYYGDNEGIWPLSLTGLVAILDSSSNPKYLDELPTVKIGRADHSDLATETTAADDVVDDGANWWYNTDAGRVRINCTHTDTKAAAIHSW